MSGLIYLASPYSHPDPTVMEWRAEEAARYAAKFARKGTPIFCPISHSHPWTKYDVPQSWEFWEQFDLHFMRICDQLWVLMMSGWTVSVGVQSEIAMFRHWRRPVRYICWTPGCNGDDPSI